MASGSCEDAFAALVKCMEKEENAGKYAHTLDLMASGAGEWEADANRRLVLELTKMQEAQLEAQKEVATMELERKACKDAYDAVGECAAAGGMTTTKVPLPCLEALVSLRKCWEG